MAASPQKWDRSASRPKGNDGAAKRAVGAAAPIENKW
jgi:hypothetical protein